MRYATAFFFSNSELVEFLNKNKIDPSQIVAITHSNFYTLVYTI